MAQTPGSPAAGESHAENMRVLQIEKFIDSSGAVAGGVGRYVRTLTELLKSQGHSVLNFGCAGRAGPAGMPKYFDFTATRNPLALLKLIHNRQAAACLDKFLQANPVDVAHVHNIYHHLTPSIFPVLARHGVGVVMTVHDYRLACPTKFFLRRSGVCTRCLGNKFWHAASPRCAGAGGVALAVESWCNSLLGRYGRFVDTFLCPTEYMCDVLRRTGLAREQISLLPNPVEFPRESPQEVSAGGYVLFAGRVSPEKSPEMMIEIARRLPQARIIIAGDGPVWPQLREQLDKSPLDNVTLPGHVGSAEMASLYAGASAVVITSRWMENSPAVMLEALAQARPVVAPSHAPLREWITDGVTGRLFPPGDAEQLAQVVGELLDDATQARRLGQAGRELVLARHDSDKILQAIERFYERATQRCVLR